MYGTRPELTGIKNRSYLTQTNLMLSYNPGEAFAFCVDKCYDTLKKNSQPPDRYTV